MTAPAHFAVSGSDLSPSTIARKGFGSLHFWEGRPRRWESPVPYKTQTALCSTTEAFFLSALVQFGNCWTCSGPNFGWFGKYAGGFRCGLPTDSIASLRATDTAWAYLPMPAPYMARKHNCPSCPENTPVQSESNSEVCRFLFEYEKCGVRSYWIEIGRHLNKCSCQTAVDGSPRVHELNDGSFPMNV